MTYKSIIKRMVELTVNDFMWNNFHEFDTISSIVLNPQDDFISANVELKTDFEGFGVNIQLLVHDDGEVTLAWIETKTKYNGEFKFTIIDRHNLNDFNYNDFILNI